jgi:glycosyltransferase involved in cell wall biosynthesis
MEIAVLVLALLGFFLAVCGLNFFTAFRLDQVKLAAQSDLPSASVLIPARNEAHNLVQLIPSLLNSNYKAFEILLLNDGSEDQTEHVARSLLEKSEIPYQVIAGQKWDFASGVSGKNYACQQLAEVAQGEILIFCDADVIISPDTVQRTLSLIQQNPKASGLSGLPKIKSDGFFENLIFPWVMQIPLIVSLPLGFAWRFPFASMQLANGQWLAIRKEAYHKIGGHQALGAAVIEDIQLAKNLVQKSLGGLIPVLAAKDISVQMYSDWNSMVKGFSKNLILIFGGSSTFFIFLLMLVNFIFFFPFWFLSVSLLEIVLGLLLLFFIRVSTAVMFGSNFKKAILQFLLHWPSLVVLNYFSILVLYNYTNKKTEWKGRKTQQAGLL